MARGANNSPKADAVSEIENITTHTTLHLGDGRKIAPGERAVVARPLAVLLHDRKQAKVIK